MIIGKWNNYNVNLIKNKDKTYWTITDKNGKKHNRFNDPESFGHWVFHSGFKPNIQKGEK